MRPMDIDLPPLALTLGDPSGIGPELALAAWHARIGQTRLPPFFLVADPDFVERTAERLGFSVPVAAVSGPPEAGPERFGSLQEGCTTRARSRLAKRRLGL